VDNTTAKQQNRNQGTHYHDKLMIDIRQNARHSNRCYVEERLITNTHTRDESDLRTCKYYETCCRVTHKRTSANRPLESRLVTPGFWIGAPHRFKCGSENEERRRQKNMCKAFVLNLTDYCYQPKGRRPLGRPYKCWYKGVTDHQPQDVEDKDDVNE
jgi:hypothetical protein